MNESFWRWVFRFLIVGQVLGCASPAQRMDARASGLGYQKEVVPGAGFNHVAYIKPGLVGRNAVLHVYLEGDGAPWLRKGLAAADPTPRTPLMLDLMSLDPAPAVYLGRPCYNGLNDAETCTPEVWTDGRYSEVVVASMSAALERLSRDYPRLVLLGYSGGGTLAMLIAERQPKTVAVVTVAANLDTARWAALHKQLSLSGSLNPASRSPLEPHIRQMHFAGGRDDNVPSDLVRNAVSRQHDVIFRVFPKQDHSCCWREVWPEILGALVAN